MKIIPVINCPDFDCVRSRLEVAQGFLCDHGSSNRFSTQTHCNCWVHIDVADGGFTDGYETWRNPTELRSAKFDRHLNIEVHLMLNEPELALADWLDAGVRRIIVHLKVATAIDTMANLCSEKGVELWLALAPDTPAEKAFPYLGLVAGCQVLAVHPGKTGQAMLPGTIEKIQALRTAFPKLPIEVDGGVTAETVAQYANAGVSQAVAGSAIFNADNPALAYAQLSRLAESQ